MYNETIQITNTYREIILKTRQHCSLINRIFFYFLTWIFTEDRLNLHITRPGGNIHLYFPALFSRQQTQNVCYCGAGVSFGLQRCLESCRPAETTCFSVACHLAIAPSSNFNASHLNLPQRFKRVLYASVLTRRQYTSYFLLPPAT